MATCVYCGDDYSDERKAIGKDYCMSKDCVRRGVESARFVEVGYGKSGVDLLPPGSVTSEDLKSTGNRGR